MKSLSENLHSYMASITIRNLDDSVKARLRMAAATHGCSMEEEARRILRSALMVSVSPGQLGTRIHQRFTAVGGVDLPDPDRTTPRPAPGFTDSDQ